MNKKAEISIGVMMAFAIGAILFIILLLGPTSSLAKGSKNVGDTAKTPLDDWDGDGVNNFNDQCCCIFDGETKELTGCPIVQLGKKVDAMPCRSIQNKEDIRECKIIDAQI